MKDKNIKTINTAGLIGYIVSILLIICSITGMVAIALGTAAAISVADDQVNVKVSTDVDISATDNILDKLNHFIGIDGVDDLNELIAEDGASVKVDDKDLSEVTVSQDGKDFKLNAKTKEIVFSVKRVIAALVSAFLMLGAVTVSLEMLKSLMKSLKSCETPFSADIIKKMTRFAYSLIPSIILYVITNAFWSSLSSGSDFSATVNLSSVLLVAIVCLLIVVFKYGAQLQIESDETL